MAINEKVKRLYDVLNGAGAQVGTEDEFNEWFFKPGEEGYKNRKRVYDTFKAEGAEVGKDYEEFAGWLNLQPVQKKTTAPNGENGGMNLNDVQGTVMGGVAGGVEPGSYAQNFAYGLQEGADKNINLEGQNSNIKGRPDLVESLNNYGSTIKTTPTTTTTTITKPSTSPSGGGSTGNGGSGASWSTGKSVTTSSGKTLRVVPQEELYVDDKGKPALGVTNEDVQSIERSDLYYPLMRNDSINLRSTEAFRKGWLANPKYDKNRKFKEAKAAGYKAQGEKFKNLTDAELVKAMREEEKKLDGSTNPEALQASMNVTYIETLMAAREWGLGDVANLQTAPNMVDYHQAKAQFNKNGLVDKYENNMLTGKDDNPLLIRGWELIEEQWAKDEAAGNRRSASYYRNLPFHNPKFAEEFGAYITARIKRTGERWNDAVKDAIDDFEVAAEEGRVGQRHSEEYLGSANREQVDELLGNVNSSLEKRMAELDKKESDMGWFSNLGNVGAAPDTKDSKRLGDPEYGNYLWAGRALNDAKKIISAFDANTLDDGLVGFFKGAGRGLVDSLGDLSTWDGGISDLLSAQRLDNAVGKFINGKPLTKSEKALLEATSLKMATAAIFKEIGRGYKAGKVTGDSLPFMIDMALNPLSKSGNTIAKGLAKYAQKHLGKYLEKIVMKLGRSSAGKIATKILGSGVTKKAVKAAARAAGDIVAAGGMSATSGVGHSLANAYGYHHGEVQYQQGVGGKTHFGGVKGGDDWVTSTLKGFGSTTIENASEMWGEYFKPITKFLSGVGGKTLEKMHLGAVNRWLEDINSTEMARLAADFRKQTRWDGSIAEYFEEVAGNIANALTIKDMNFALHDKNGKFSLKEENSVFNAQDNLDTFLGVSLMSGSMGAVNIVGYRTPKYRAKQDMKRYGDMAKRIFAANGNDWSTIASIIQNNNEDSRKQLVVDLMQSGKYSKREKQIALQYAGAVYKSMGMDIGESKQQRSAGDQEASEAYGRGYNMATLENISETSSTYQQLRTQMEQDYGTELMQRMDKEPGLAYGWIRNGAVSEEDAKKVLDYLNAKMAYEGAVDRLNDDEAAAKSAAELQVEESAYKEENGGDGQIHPVTLKGREGEFFVVSGDVVTGNDGAVDVNASSDAIVVVDNQGKRQMTTAKDIDQVGDVIDVESAKAAAVAEIETAAQETTNATATDDVEQGDEVGADAAGATGNYDGVLDAMGIEDDQARQALGTMWADTPPADAMDVLNDLMGENNPEQRESNKVYWAQQPEVFNSQWRYMMGDVTPDQVNAALAAQNETAASAASAPVAQAQPQTPSAQGQAQPAQVQPQAQAAQAGTSTPLAATTPGHYEQDDDVVLNVGGEQITGFISNVLPDGKLRLQLDAPINGNVVVDVTPEELDKMVAQPQSSGEVSGESGALAPQGGTAASAATTPTAPAGAPEAPQQSPAPSTGIVSDNNTPIPMVDGKTDYSAATPERAHHNIYNERGLSKERADKVVAAAIAKREAEAAAANEAVAKARRALEKHQAKDIDIDNIDADMAEEQRLADALRDAEAQAAQAQNAVDYWKRVKDVEDAANRSAEESAASGEVAAPAAPQETAGETQAPAPQEESSMLSANESGEPSSTQTNEGESGEETAPAAEEELTPDERIERARMEALENRAEELAESCGIPVRICRSLEEIPARYRKAFETARGTGKKKSYVNGFFFHKKTANGEINEIVLYLPDIAANGGMWRLERTFLHEAVAHGGLRALFQNAQDGIQTFNDLCDKVWNEIMPTGEKRKYRDYVLQNKYGQEPYEEIKKQYRKEGKSLDDLMTDALKREAADEYMAHQAEWGVDRSILDKIIKAVREALRKIKWINKRMRLSDRDVLDLLAASHRNLTEMDKQMLNQDVADELDRLALAGEDNGGSTLMSTTAIMEGGGLEVSREVTDKDGKVTKEPLVDDEGNLVAKYNGKEYSAKNPITAEDLREGDMEGNEATVLQMLINDARDAKNITDEQAAKIYQNYADMINLFLKCGSAENGGADTVMENWEWLGESVFRAVAANGDAQYSYSMDITKVCKKNEAVIKSISALQLREGRGATPSEIVEIYRDTHVEGYQVPCPVCYVFTRYIRNGKYASAAITGMEEYGEHLPGGKNPWTLKQWRDELNRLDRTMNPDSKQKCTDAEKEQAKRFKKQLDEANDITVYYEDRVNALSFLLTSKFTSEARKKEILEELRVIDAQYKAAVNIIARQSLTNWIKTFAIQEKDGKWTMREDAKIPEDMDDFKKNALDLRLTANTILNYPAIQRLRKSGGSAAGKEISFPSDNRLGEVVSGLGINKSSLNTYSNVYEEVLKAPNEKERKKLRKKASDRFKAASEYAQQQTLRGGQRMWSWSDNIERLSPDIAINIMQLQLLGGAMQTYSKQLEGIKLAAQMGAYVNGSLMAKDNGWEEVKDSECYERDGELWLKKDRYDYVNEPRVGKRPRKRKRIIAAKDSHVYQAEDGRKYVLVYDDVVGVDPFGNEHNGERKKGLFQLNSELDRAGNILVGMNDLHVRAAMADPAVFFIIPWHSSGAHNHILNEMLEILGQHMTDRLDYTAMQEEKNMLERNKDTKKLPEVTQRLRDLWEEGRQWAEQNKWKSGMEVDSNGDVITESQYMYRALRSLIFDGSIFEAMPTEEQYQEAVDIVNNMQTTVDDLNARNEAWKAKSPEYKKSPEGKAEKKEIDDARTKANKAYKPAVHTIELHDGLIDWRDSSQHEGDAEWQEQHPKRINVEEARRIIEADEFLKQVYDRVSNTPGQKMTSGDNTYIYPYEYWQETDKKGNPADIKDADINGKRYVEYCRRMGYKPKFSGNWKTADVEKQNQGNFVHDPGYWKLLIDRRMYDRNGKYQWLDPVDSDNFETSLVDPRETHKEFHVTTVADDKAADDIAQKVFDRLSTRTESGFAAADYDKPLGQIMDEYDAALAAGVQNGKIKLTAAEESLVERMKAATVEGAEETEDSGVMFSTSPTFYSNAERAVENIKQNKATAEQWKAMLTKAGGIKAGEDKWMGLSTWLDENKGKSLTKDEVLQFVRDNGIQMEEVNYGDLGENLGDMQEVIAKDLGIGTAEFNFDPESGEFYFEIFDDDEAYELAQTVNDRHGFVDEDDYNSELKFVYDVQDEINAYIEEKYGNPTSKAVRGINPTRLEYTTKGLENKREIAFVVPNIEPYQVHDEVHFGPENQGKAVMWVRFGEASGSKRVEITHPITGEKTTARRPFSVLVIDEIQSNRHQGGREKGYKVDKAELPEKAESDKATQAFKDYQNSLEEKYGDIDKMTADEARRYNELADEMGYAYNRYMNALVEFKKRNSDAVPAAPFEKNWHEVAMKRMLRLAAEEGFDKVAWTTGEQQVERYNLSKVLSSINSSDWGDNIGMEDTKVVTLDYNGGDAEDLIVNRNGEIVADVGDMYINKTLADVVGKEMTDKLMADGEVTISGNGLRIGGEGMKGFYDQMLPRFMNKYGKRWGVKVEDIQLDTPGKEVMHAVDVTPEMKESVMQGQPLFSVSNYSLGAPYQGTKGRIANQIVDDLPSGERFVDLFAGGGAVTHAAILSGKYGSYHMNDINPVGQELFLQGVRGEWENYDRTSMTPEEFNEIKGTPESLPWSYNGLGRNLVKGGRPDYINRMKRLGQLKQYADDITSTNEDYRDVEIRPGDVVYADIPYENTDTRGYGKGRRFDKKAFCDWAQAQDFPIFVSEYTMPEGWVEIDSIEVGAMRRNDKRTEKLWVQEKFADQYRVVNAIDGTENEAMPRNTEQQPEVRFSTTAAVDTLKDDERVYNDLLGKVFSGVSNETRRGIVGDAMENRGYDFGAATEAWLMGLADDETFAQVPQEDWRAVKNALGDALRENGVEGSMTDNEARYVLWKAGQIEDGVFSMAEDIVKRDELLNGARAPQYTDNADVRFSTSPAEQIYSDNFKNWFGDWENDPENASKVVDEDGRPLVVYRGGEGINVFEPDRASRNAMYGQAFYATPSYADAQGFAKVRTGDGSNVQAVYLDVRNPWVDGPSESLGYPKEATMEQARELVDLLIQKGLVDGGIILAKWNDGRVRSLIGSLSSAEYEGVERGKFDWWHASNIVQDALKELGYDGVIGRFDSGDGMVDQIAVFSPTQIKSATENNGDFSRENPDIRYSVTPRDRAIARDQYDRMMRSGRYQFVEAVQDSMLGLKKLMEAIMGDSYEYIEDIPMYENPYITENLMSSSNAAQQHEYSNRLMAPILKEINKLTKGKNKARNELIDYMMAKHGLERNKVLADRDAQETAAAGGNYQDAYAENRERDYAGLTALTGEDDVHAAEAKAQQMVADYEQQHDTTELWGKVNAATKTTLAKLYQCGIMSKETYQKTRDMFEYYIPLRGYDEKTSDKVYGYLTSKDGPLTGGSIMKRAGGRTSKADDPFSNIAMMADKAITEGNRNLMKQTFLNFVRNHPSDAVSVSELWLQYDATKDEWVPVFPKIPADASPAEVEQITEQFEADMQQLAQQEPNKYKHGRETANIPYKVIPGNEREHQVLVKMRGQTYVLTINGNPRAAQAINGLTNPDTEATKVIGKILEKAQAINRGMSAVYTTMNPDFVVSNFLRDMYYANTMVYVKEKGNYGVKFNANVAKLNPLTIYYLLQKWENGTLNENKRIEKLFKQFMLNGGETGYTTLWDVERYKKSIDKELRKQNNIALKAMGTLGGQLEMFNRSVENVARFAAFVTSVEMGRSYGRAAYDAKEISVNFNKKGSGGTMFGATGQTFLGNVGAAVSSVGRQFFVFWNAGVQGMTNFGRNTKRHPVKGGLGAASLFGLGILIPLLAGAGGGDGDDEDKNAYYNLPEYIRRSNLCIYADGKWVTIPLPVEYRAIYGLGELAYGVVAGKERYSDEELAMQISSQFSQLLPIDMLEGGGGWHPFIPTLLKPIVETSTNTSWSGLPIHPDSPFDDGKYMPEYTKVYQSTDKDLIKLSEFLNRVTGGNGRKKGMVDINPANIEYWLNGYLGGLFTFPIKVKKSAETAFGDREFEWKNIPFANRVIKEGDERTEAKKLKNEFFKYKEEYEETKWRLQGYGKDTDQGVFNYAKELADMNYSKEYGRYVIFDKYAKDFEDLEKIKKRIADGTLPAEMKQEYDAEDMRLKRQLVQEMHAYEDGKYTPDKPKAEDQYKPKEEETKVTIQKHASSFDEVRMVDEFSNTGNQYKPANNDVMVEAQKLGMKMRYYKQKNKVKHELGLSGSTWNLDGDKSAEKKRFYNSHKALLDRVGRYRWREREIGRLMDEAKEKKSKEASNYKRIYQIIQDDIKDEEQFQRSQKK